MAQRQTPKDAAESLRTAVDRTVQATVGQAAVTRDRAQDLVDDVAQAAGRVRDVLEDLRVATKEDIRDLRDLVLSMQSRISTLEANLKPKVKSAAATPRRAAAAARPKPKAKAKPTTVKKKPAAIKQDDNMSKKSTQQPPSKISIQVIRELFEDAKNKKAITATVYLEFAEVWEHFNANKGNKEIKAADSKKLRSLYAEHLYKK